MGLLLYEKPFRHTVGSVTRLYRSCSIRDTGSDDYRREGGRRTGQQRSRARREQPKERENLGEIPEGRGAGGGRGKRESTVHRGGEGQTGKMREVIRRNGAKEFSVVRLRSTKRERKRGRGWELNGAGS